MTQWPDIPPGASTDTQYAPHLTAKQPRHERPRTRRFRPRAWHKAIAIMSAGVLTFASISSYRMHHGDIEMAPSNASVPTAETVLPELTPTPEPKPKVKAEPKPKPRVTVTAPPAPAVTVFITKPGKPRPRATKTIKITKTVTAPAPQQDDTTGVGR